MERRDAETLIELAGLHPGDPFPLFDAAIACSVHETPYTDEQPARKLIKAAVKRLKAHLETESPLVALASTLAVDLGFTGDAQTYDDLANADILAVCRRRKGLPVALGLIYLEVGRRAGLTLFGLDLPGHFLLRLDGEAGSIAIDPFNGGRQVPSSELALRGLQAGLSADLTTLMTPMADRGIIIRLQNNILSRAVQMGDHAMAERAALRRCLLEPANTRLWLDVAAAREAQGALSGALEAISRVGSLDGDEDRSAKIAQERMKRKLN